VKIAVTWFNLFIPLLSFSGNVVFQVLWFRSRPNYGLLNSEYLSFTVGLVIIASLQIFLNVTYPQSLTDMWSVSIFNLLIYGGLSYCYFHFINLCLTARRIRLVRDLYGKPNGLTLDQLLENYNSRVMVERRTARLLNSGQIFEKNGRYFIGKPMVLFAAWVMVILKFIFLGKGSEYD
jgi:hypothetical protein